MWVVEKHITVGGPPQWCQWGKQYLTEKDAERARDDAAKRYPNDHFRVTYYPNA